MQVVIYDEDMARPLRSEFVIQITGEVRLRPDGNENTHLATGKIEVVAETIEILAKSDACRSRFPPLLRMSPRTSCRARTCV